MVKNIKIPKPEVNSIPAYGHWLILNKTANANNIMLEFN